MKIDTSGLKSFIDDNKIWETLEKAKNPDLKQIDDVLAKAMEKRGLTLQEAAILLQITDPEHTNLLFSAAKKIKEEIYGNRIVLFAPLYVGNECVNDCVYCGFRISNKDCFRKTLSKDELVAETIALEKKGHKRLIMVYGEHTKYSPQFIHDTVKKVYETKFENGEIRRVNINAAPLDVKGYKIVKEAGIGTYQIFQETYHQKTYEKLHPSGPKSNYLWRLYGLDRAMQAGIDDLGIGALIGLYNWRFEILALLTHAYHLDQTFGVGPHTISFPRIEPAFGSDFTEQPPNAVSDENFKKLVAVLRLSVPYTGMILTAREPIAIRDEVIALGVSQIDGGSAIGIGEYSAKDDETFKKTQFVLGDNRSLDEVIYELAKAGYIPSFCTACYRLGRTGEHFMELSKPGEIKSFCQPNAILTFLEYLTDYASEKTKKMGLNFIEKEVSNLSQSIVKPELDKKINELKNGARDLYF